MEKIIHKCKDFVAIEDIVKYLEEEIDYLETHVKKANKGIKINIERVESWIFQTKKILPEIKKK